ncbi:hypothetical protein HPA02_34880 [Bisbaumannia pacifica]|uniref:Uncharacterized protein n=1 Tax=Bisbaumannia pacifica TaxID=77098 RepID=A0A510XF96_9GAMM|nr:hypothetical protein [Halomonas pacifica]GEK49205.1 hypothetical protein HPA02_34880 [Halomonas pacifica]
MINNPVLIEHRAQQRAQGVVIAGPQRPIIASRPFDPERARDAQGLANARRWADYHARRAGQAAALIQLWR